MIFTDEVGVKVTDASEFVGRSRQTGLIAFVNPERFPDCGVVSFFTDGCANDIGLLKSVVLDREIGFVVAVIAGSDADVAS